MKYNNLNPSCSKLLCSRERYRTFTIIYSSESSTDVHSRDRQMQSLHSQLNSLKGHLKEVVNSREAYEQEIQRLKGDLTTMTQENQVNFMSMLCALYSYTIRLYMKNCAMLLKNEKH